MSASTDTTIALADLPGVSRTVLATIIAESPGLALVAQASTLDQLEDELDATHPDVVVLDDRLLRARDWRAPADVRLVVIGIDDDPAYAARARSLGADVWVAKDRSDLLLLALQRPAADLTAPVAIAA